MKSRSRLTTRLRTGIPFSSHSILSGRENKKKPKRQLDARKEKPAQGSSNITGGQMTTTTTMLCSVVCNMPIDRRERTRPRALLGPESVFPIHTDHAHTTERRATPNTQRRASTENPASFFSAICPVASSTGRSSRLLEPATSPSMKERKRTSLQIMNAGNGQSVDEDGPHSSRQL